MLFNLTVANDGQLPVKTLNWTSILGGLKVPNVGFLIFEEPNRVLERKHHTALPGIIGWNLIWLTYQVFVEKYGGEVLNSFGCTGGVYPLLFSQLCLHHYMTLHMMIKHYGADALHFCCLLHLHYIKQCYGHMHLWWCQCITSCSEHYKGGSWPLFIIGNADIKLTTSVLFCLPQVNEHYWFDYLHFLLNQMNT